MASKVTDTTTHKRVPCPFCGGRGWHDWHCRAGTECGDCDGTGRVPTPTAGSSWQSNQDPSYRLVWDGTNWAEGDSDADNAVG